jgi:two-component system sensor histidine kinase BaeS
LLAAFLFVALSSVAVLTVAGLVGTARGLTSAQQSDRRQATARTAEAAAAAYERAGGWAGADLTAASAIAGAAGARLIVRDGDDQMVWPGRGMGPAMGGMHTDTAAVAVIEAPVVTGGQTAGSVRLAFSTTGTAGTAVPVVGARRRRRRAADRPGGGRLRDPAADPALAGPHRGRAAVRRGRTRRPGRHRRSRRTR